MTSGYGVCDTDRLTCGHVPYFPQTSLLGVEILDLYELKRTEEEKKCKIQNTKIPMDGQNTLATPCDNITERKTR